MKLVEAYELVPELVSHLHLPVQSGSDRILQLMKRNYTARRIISVGSKKLRAVRPALVPVI